MQSENHKAMGIYLNPGNELLKDLKVASSKDFETCLNKLNVMKLDPDVMFRLVDDECVIE